MIRTQHERERVVRQALAKHVQGGATVGLEDLTDAELQDLEGALAWIPNSRGAKIRRFREAIEAEYWRRHPAVADRWA